MAFDIAEVITNVDSQLVQATDFLHEYRTQIIASIKAKAEAIRDRANLGDFGADVTAAGREGLTALNDAYTAELARQLDPVFSNILRLAGRPGGDPDANFSFVYQFLQENSLTFLARGPIYALLPAALATSGKGTTPSAGSIVGDATIVQLLLDRYGNSLDAGNPLVEFFVKCITDLTNGGTKYSEVFRVSSDTSFTIFDRGPVGEGFDITIPNNGGGILKKSGFKIGNVENLNPTNLGVWIQPNGDYSNFDLVDDPVYRPDSEELGTNRTPLALRFNDEDIIQQTITADLSRSTPYLPGLSVHRQNSCDRLVTVRVGKETIINSFDMSTIVNDTWSRQIGTIDEKLFLDNFEPINGDDDLVFEIEVHGGTVGEVVIDNVGFWPGIPLNGRWVWMIPGQKAHVLDDEFVFTDGALAENGKHAQVIVERYGRHVPTITSPTAPAVPEP